jgi:DNA-binding HxlR family transcriptional regulator
MEETIVVKQRERLKKNIQTFFKQSMSLRSEYGKCMVKDELAMLLDKWSLFVLYNLGFFEVLRFKELKEKIRGISSKMLSQTLKKLESQNVVQRKVYAEVPPRVEYRLTQYGADLTEQVLDLNQWFLENYDAKK